MSPFAGTACCCSSSSIVKYSSLFDTCSSKFVEPVHGMFSVALVFVVQSSSSRYGLLPFVGLTNVILAGPGCVTSGPSCVCCGM